MLWYIFWYFSTNTLRNTLRTDDRIWGGDHNRDLRCHCFSWTHATPTFSFTEEVELTKLLRDEDVDKWLCVEAFWIECSLWVVNGVVGRKKGCCAFLGERFMFVLKKFWGLASCDNFLCKEGFSSWLRTLLNRWEPGTGTLKPGIAIKPGNVAAT